LEKEDLLTFITRVFSIIFSIEFLQFLASNIAQPKYRSKHGTGTFRGSNSTKHHGKHFKPNTYVHISKIKDEQTNKARKASQETKI
jgi:cytochrome c peroxidase